MPCGCRIPATEYPESAEWGPIAWDILHGLAERSGHLSNKLAQEDEKRHWIFLFESIEKMIPCTICREHYRVFLLGRPVKSIADSPYESLNPFVKKWFWTLHGEIYNGTFNYEDLTAKYGSVPIKQRLDQLAAPIQRAMTHNGVKLLHWKAFEREVRTLLGMY